MILILSRESAEITTDKVIDWLEYYNVKYFRLNGEDLLNGKCDVNFYLNKKSKKWEFNINYEDLSFNSNEINAIWYRRSFDWDIDKRFWKSPSNIEEYEFLIELNSYHQREIREVYKLIENVLNSKYWLNRPSKSNLNKFNVLSIAQQVGIEIPSSLVTNNIIALKNFVKKETHCITKPSVDGFFLRGHDFGISTLTKRIDAEIISKFNRKTFTPSLFQNEVKKEYEIRVIFIENEVFAVAMFSQKSTKTEIDYRNYNNENPNRLQLIELPSELLFKIRLLMNNLELNFGSIDIIKSVNGNYYFLEINPVGQFLGISDELNLEIEKKISKILIKKNEV